jgi:hypothetical protein
MVKQPGKPTALNTVHFACFDCRKAFKQRGSSNCDPDVPQRPFPCPECKRPMARMGRYFRPPPERAGREWLKVELLYHYGERFESGHSGLEAKCRSLASTVAHLAGPGRPEADVRETLGRIRASHSNGGGA